MQIRPTEASRVAGPAPAFRSAASPAATFAKAEKDDFAETLRQLARMTGNRKALDRLEEAQRRSEARLSRNIPAFDDSVREQVRACLQGQGPAPSGFDAEHRGFLDSMASLHRRGVQFVDSSMQPLDSVEAFERMVTRPDERDFSRQAFYKAYETQTVDMMGTPVQMSGVTTSTLRAEFLAALDHFVEHVGQGRVFLGDDGKPFETASTFIKEHWDDFARFEPMVSYDGAFVTVPEFERLEQERRRDEVERLAGRGREGAPEVKDLGGEIAIGGVVLAKRGG